MPSFICSYSYIKAKLENSLGKSVRTLLAAERKGLWNGVLQKEGKCSWRAGGKVVGWRSLGRVGGRWKIAGA